MKDFDSYDQFEAYARSIWPEFEKYLNSLKGTINKENFAKAKESILLLAEMVKKHDKAAKFSAKECPFKSGSLDVVIRTKKAVFDDMKVLKKALNYVYNIDIDPLTTGEIEIGITYRDVFTYAGLNKW